MSTVAAPSPRDQVESLVRSILRKQQPSARRPTAARHGVRPPQPPTWSSTSRRGTVI